MGNIHTCTWIGNILFRKNKSISRDIQCEINSKDEVFTKDIGTDISLHFLKLNNEHKSHNIDGPLKTDPLNASFITTRPLISQVLQADVITQTSPKKDQEKYQADLESLSKTIGSLTNDSFLQISDGEYDSDEKSDSVKQKSYSATNYRSKSHHLSQQSYFRELSHLRKRSALVCSMPDQFETNRDFPTHYSRSSKDSKELSSNDDNSKIDKSFNEQDDQNDSQTSPDASEYAPSVIQSPGSQRSQIQMDCPLSPVALKSEVIPEGDVGVRLPYKDTRSASTSNSVDSINWPHQRDIISNKSVIVQSPKDYNMINESHVLVNMSSISTKQIDTGNYKNIDTTNMFDQWCSSDDNVQASIVNDKGDEESPRNDCKSYSIYDNNAAYKSFKGTEEINKVTDAIPPPYRRVNNNQRTKKGVVSINRTPQIYDNRIKGLERDVKQVFHVYDDHRLLQVLADDKDRRIKAICDKYGCSLVIYAKPPWKGFIRFAITIRAPTKAMMKMCIRALDSAMKWNISSQLK